MQQKPLVLLLSAAILALAGHPSQAQQTPSTSTSSGLTRAQVKMEREDFIKSHRWDSANETWVLRPEFEPPSGMKTRAQVRQDREEFLSKNKWDATTEAWIPLAKPRTLSQLTREQVRNESREFLRTHDWDAVAEAWVLRKKVR
jgi:hypothetical protein